MAEPTSARELIENMPAALVAKAAEGLDEIVQFNMTAPEPGQYWLHIVDGACSFHEGEAPAPTLTITAPSDVWLDVALGRTNGQMAFMMGKFKADGDLTLLMKLGKLFKKK
jgi:putative sterol carrier protein